MPLPPGRTPLSTSWFDTWFKSYNTQTLQFPQVNRVEVIDEHGRSYTTHSASKVTLSVQDGGRTLKIFTAGIEDDRN